jgi:hypothetical protein
MLFNTRINYESKCRVISALPGSTTCVLLHYILLYYQSIIPRPLAFTDGLWVILAFPDTRPWWYYFPKSLIYKQLQIEMRVNNSSVGTNQTWLVSSTASRSQYRSDSRIKSREDMPTVVLFTIRRWNIPAGAWRVWKFMIDLVGICIFIRNQISGNRKHGLPTPVVRPNSR